MRLVAGYGGIDFPRPNVDAAGETPNLGEAAAAQKMGRLGGTHSVMAVYDNRALFIGETLRSLESEAGERNEFRAFDSTVLPF